MRAHAPYTLARSAGGDRRRRWRARCWGAHLGRRRPSLPARACSSSPPSCSPAACCSSAVRCRLWTLLPRRSRLPSSGVHESFGLVAAHTTAPPPRPGRGLDLADGRGARVRHPAHRVPCGGPADERDVRRPSARPPALPVVAEAAAMPPGDHRTLARPPPRLSTTRAAPGGPSDLSPVRARVRTRPRTAPYLRRTMSIPYVRAPLARSRPPPRPSPSPSPHLRGPTSPRPRRPQRPAPTRSSRSACGHGCEGSPTTKIEIQVPESVLVGDPDPQPLLRGRDDHRSTSTSRSTDAHGNEVTERVGSSRLHRRHAAPRGPARHLRAVVPAARRGGRGADVPDDPDLPEG